MRRLLLVCALVLLASSARAQNCVTVNGASVCTATTPTPSAAMAVRQAGTGFAFCVQSTAGVNLWCVDKTGASTSTVASIFGVDAIAATSTDGVIIRNATLATAGATVQMSPRLKWCGAAWNSTSGASESDCMFAEVLPVSVAGTTTATFKIGYINNAGTVTTPVTLTSAGSLTTSGSLIAGGTLQIFNAGRIGATADKLWQLNDTANATGTEISNGSATLGTCTGGTITTGSHNFAGGYTGNTSSSCVINFGTPNWTNAPFCVAMSIASTTHPRVSAVATSSITITGGVSGEAITYLCMGRIGI